MLLIVRSSALFSLSKGSFGSELRQFFSSGTSLARTGGLNLCRTPLAGHKRSGTLHVTSSAVCSLPTLA